MARTPSRIEAFEEQAFPLVVELLTRRGYERVERNVRRGSVEWDGLAHRKGEKPLGVEITGKLTSTKIEREIERLSNSEELGGLLVVTADLVSASLVLPWEERARDRGLQLEILDIEDLAGQIAENPVLARSRLLSIHLENVRGFRNFNLDLGDRGNTIIIGRNGTGKSTLLRAIGLALSAPGDVQALLSHPTGTFVREGSRTARISAELRDAGSKQSRRVSMTIHADPGRPVIHDEAGPLSGCFVCGYGIGRSASGAEQPATVRTLDTIASLFDLQRTLAGTELVLRRLQDHIGTKRYAAAMAGIRRVLGLGRGHSIAVARGGGIRVSGRGIGKDIPLEGWADGYRMTFQWLVDFYGWALQADTITNKGGIQGVLLIDELEQHLHPAMQAGLLTHLHKLLPDTQIIASTHSPLVALGAPREIVALHRRGAVVEQVEVPDLSGYSAQDALIEEALFGTDPYAPATRKKLDEHQKLARVSKSKRSAKQRQRLAQLAEELGPANKPELRNDPVLAELRQLQALLAKQVAE